MWQVHIQKQGELERRVEEAKQGSNSLQAQLTMYDARLEQFQLATEGLQDELNSKLNNVAALQTTDDQLTKVRTSVFVYLCRHYVASVANLCVYTNNDGKAFACQLVLLRLGCLLLFTTVASRFLSRCRVFMVEKQHI